MNAREERGLIIAAMCRLNRTDDGTWLVPAQSKNAQQTCYRVNLKAKTCTCLDHTEGGHTCKHYYAATFVYKRDTLPDGTVIEQSQFAFTEKRVTYKQDWPAYNEAHRLDDAFERPPDGQGQRLRTCGRDHPAFPSNEQWVAEERA